MVRGRSEYATQRLAGSDQFEKDFEHILALLRQVRPIEPGARLFEIGAGLGWFEVLAELKGFHIEAIEHNPEFVEIAAELGAKAGVKPTIHVADARTWDYGTERYDAVVATSVFEHIREYRAIFHKVYRALKPGGVLYFYSTNKWSPRSGEYPQVPLYGWLPYSVRERIRVKASGDRGVVDRAEMDFNQFTYWGLRRDLRRAGFGRIVDLVDLADPAYFRAPSAGKRLALEAIKKLPPLRLAAQTFATGNLVVAVNE
jgi:SAM-dependent methyltransferase